MGKKLLLETRKVTLVNSYIKPQGFTHFLKGIFDGRFVTLPEGQESYKLNSFARANCLVMIPDSTKVISAGEEVEIHLLP